MRNETVTMLRSGTSHHTFFLVLAVMEAPPAYPEIVARQIEDAVFSAHSDIFGPIDVVIVVRHGFDFGFAMTSSDFKLVSSVAHWQARTKQRTL